MYQRLTLLHGTVELWIDMQKWLLPCCTYHGPIVKSFHPLGNDAANYHGNDYMAFYIALVPLYLYAYFLF